MRYLFRPPATDAAGLLAMPWHQPLAEWDPALLLDVPQRGISRHVVRFVAVEDRVYALKEINERLARHEYALLAQFEAEGLPTGPRRPAAPGRPPRPAQLARRPARRTRRSQRSASAGERFADTSRAWSPRISRVFSSGTTGRRRAR